MTEQQYQENVQALWQELSERGNTLIDYLVSQPPIRLARIEVRSILEWALQAGADHPGIVKERLRRRELAAKLKTTRSLRPSGGSGDQEQPDSLQSRSPMPRHAP